MEASKLARKKPARKRPNKPDALPKPLAHPDNKALSPDAMFNLLRVLSEAGAPEPVLQAAANAQNAAASGDIQPLLEFFEAIGLDPNQIDADGGLGPTQDPCDVFPMSSPRAAAVLLANQSEDRTIEEEVEFMESVLAIDPKSVEALIGMAMECDDSDAVKYFHQACEFGVKKLKQDYRLTNYWIGLRNQMGVDLVERARLTDAIEILLPAIDEDERDGAGTRFFIIDLMLRLGWWDELGELLGRFPDDGIGPGIFAKAIRLHHLQPESEEAVKALKDAHRDKPFVAPILISPLPLPTNLASRYALGSREEGFVIARYLKPGLRANPGTIRWIRDSLNLSVDDQDGASERWKETEDEKYEEYEHKPGPGDLHIALDLPEVDETWIYHGQKNRGGDYLCLVLCEDTPVSFGSCESAPKTRELRQFILDAVCDPLFGKPRRPRLIRVANKATLNMLQKGVGTYGVACECVKPSAFEKMAFKEIAEQAGRGLKMMEESEGSSLADFDIDKIPGTDSPWFVAVMQPPIWVGDQSTPYRPYLQLVVDGEDGMILKTEMTQAIPTAKQQVETVADTMLRPMTGSPRCPGVIVTHPQLDRAEFDSAMRELTNSDCVEIVSGDDEISSLFKSLIIDMVRSNDPTGMALIEQDGVDSELLGRLYQAAARFYRVSPWNLVGGDQLIRVVSGSTPGHQWGVGVMGQMGQTMGLSVIDGVDTAKAMVREECDMNRLSAISVQFDEAFDLPPRELWQIETENYEIANEEAYPLFLRIKNGEGGHTVDAGEIRALIDMLNHLPAFLRQDRTKETTVHGVAGTASHLELQWISV
ncbi:hypothetical protein LF1_35970 [Rubripirellula obstinata]|uniref:DUF7309 domain-containing protein n=2 Tax=Rubripirellula obstinata TaxID=406547 RepID=A0A5B1CNV4_9BACT|nr:hypothetical protein LF1_35970 [Rubripirellula obstinata]